MSQIPKQHRWVFWDVDTSKLDLVSQRGYILARVLEFGGLAEVQWAIATYGLQGIHRFLRDVGHVEITERTLSFWRAVFNAEDEPWADPGAWRRGKGVPWIG